MVGATTPNDLATCELWSMNRKSKTVLLGLKLSYNALRFNPVSIMEALERPSRVKMNSQGSPLTAFPTQRTRVHF
jgi:hypothetical protein